KMIVEKKMKGEQLMLFGEVSEPIAEINEIVEVKNGRAKEEDVAIRLLREVDLNTLTPLDALMKLNELKRILK
ncbi:MAG: hypothetical protein RR656_04355, partial [Cetobacterium sp.]